MESRVLIGPPTGGPLGRGVGSSSSTGGVQLKSENFAEKMMDSVCVCVCVWDGGGRDFDNVFEILLYYTIDLSLERELSGQLIFKQFQALC